VPSFAMMTVCGMPSTLLDTLADPTTLRGVLARPDVFYETSRRLLVLRPI
jgi:hypothetical protein